MTRTKKPKAVAQMTIQKPDGSWLTVEVQADAGHNNFYHWYRGRGRGRRYLRPSHRMDGQAQAGKPIGLEILAKRFQHCTVKINIRRKRLYRKLLTCATSELPGYRAVTSRPAICAPVPVPVAIQVGEVAYATHNAD